MKRMKKFYYLLSLSLFGILFAGCNDWLDVNPRSQIKSTVLYTTEGGYKRALNGVYIKIAEVGLYGKNTSMYVPDALARMWTLPVSQTSLLYGLSTHNYTLAAVEKEISSVFSNYYNAIAQINDIVYNLENSEISFEHHTDQLIRGEAVGLRAFLHLDLLRYFGPVPVDVQENAVTIPYVTELTTDNKKLLSKSWKEVLTSIEQDLNTAESILKEYDPLVYTSVDSLENTRFEGMSNLPVDTWQFGRQGRFNYFAVLGTKARFYHWIGDKEQAIKYAKMVIDSKKFTLCDEPYFSGAAASLSMRREHLFGLDNPDMQSNVQSLFGDKGASLTQTVARVNTAYENTIHVNDIRNVTNRFWQEKTYQNSVKVNHFYKYTGNNNITNDNRIPLLRYVEMYFILTEDLPLSQAKDYFVTYRQSRALASAIDETSTTDATAVLSRLEKEYRKEFYGEGQLFFFYKKHNYTRFTWPNTYTVPAGAYEVPKPKGLTDFE